MSSLLRTFKNYGFQISRISTHLGFKREYWLSGKSISMKCCGGVISDEAGGEDLVFRQQLPHWWDLKLGRGERVQFAVCKAGDAEIPVFTEGIVDQRCFLDDACVARKKNGVIRVGEDFDNSSRTHLACLLFLAECEDNRE